MYKICVLILFSTVSTITANLVKDYCNSYLCGTLQNSACNNNGRFSPTCPQGIELYKFNETEKAILLDAINYARSLVALGAGYNASGDFFPSAHKMSHLVWDAEQEFMASLQVKTCDSHDPCKTTWFNSSYYNSPVFIGQNIYYESSNYPVRKKFELSIQDAIDAWFDEILSAPISLAGNVQIVQNAEVGHFLVLMAQDAQRVGCVASQWEAVLGDGTYKYRKITCNFFRSPILFFPLYEAGETCMGCEDTCDWTSDTAGLCMIDPASFAHTYYF